MAVERAIATLLPVLIAALLMRIAPGWLSLAIACGLTVIPYGIDMLAGSALTPRAVIGPNPGLGARFYGIGNELESLLPVIMLVGLAAFLDRRPKSRGMVAWFGLSALALGAIVGSGRLGADVGGVITIGAGGAVAVLFSLPGGITKKAVAIVDQLTGTDWWPAWLADYRPFCVDEMCGIPNEIEEDEHVDPAAQPEVDAAHVGDDLVGGEGAADFITHGADEGALLRGGRAGLVPHPLLRGGGILIRPLRESPKLFHVLVKLSLSIGLARRRLLEFLGLG